MDLKMDAASSLGEARVQEACILLFDQQRLLELVAKNVGECQYIKEYIYTKFIS